MEAIQQLLQSTGLSPDELIRKLAEFKAISEKTQCGNDINKNLPDVANGNGERSECANVTSTSDTVIKNELRTNEVVDNGCVVTGDGCCVSTTELCNNEEWKVKCVEDVEDDRLSLESNSNIKIDKPPPAITNEEKVISDKSKCIIEPAKQDCKNNDTKDTDQRNVSIGDKLDETSVNISETTLLNNNLNLTQLNDETLEYRPIEKAETILTSDANTATRNSVKSMEKQQISIEQQTSVVPRCDKSSSDSAKTEIEVCTHSRGSSDDLEDSFTEELQLTLDDFEDKVSGNEGVELHSSLGKSIRKSVEDDRKFVNLTNDIIVIDDDEDQSKNTLVDDDESQSHVILDKTLTDEDIESFSSDKTILPTENVDEQSNSSTILCTIDSDTDSSLIGHKQNTQCDDSDISQTTEIFSCDRLGDEIKNEEEKEDVLMCSKSPGSDTQERVEKVDAVSKTTENTESLEQNENNMDSNMSSQISISDKGNTDKNSESNTDDAIQMPEKDIESVVTSASDALKDIDNNSESSNHVLNDNECVKTSVNTVENESTKCEEISILQNNISSSDKTLEYPLQTENVDDKSISSTTAKTIEYSSKRDQNIDSNSIMPSSSEIFNCNRHDEFVLEKPEINMENTSSEPTQEETIVNITHSDIIKIEKEQIIELNSEGETDKNIDKSPDLVDEQNTLKCDEVINWESGDDNSPKKCVNGDISKHSKSNIPELLSISDYSKQAKHQVKNISVNKVTLINTNNDAFRKTKISNNSLNSVKDITLNVMRNGKVLEGPKSLTRKFLVNHVESTNANNKTQIKITIIKKAPLVETNTSGTIASKQDHSKFAEGLKECSSVKSNNNTNDCRNDGESDGKTNSGESNAEKDVVKRDYDDINKRINNDINKNHDEKDLNLTVMKNIDLMKLIVGRICKSQISNQDSETESINKDKTPEILENAPLTSDKLQDDLNNFPSSALADLDNQEKSCTSDDIDLTMMEDEEPCGLLDDSDYIDDDDYIKKEVDSGEGPSVSYGSIYPKSTIIDNTLTYKTNSPTTHRPLMGCIRKRKEPTVCTTPVKKPCIDDNDDIYEDAEEQIEDPVNMREKLFNQLQQLRQRKVNDTPLINIAHQIPNTYMKRKNVIKTEEENGIGSTLGIKIVDVRGGVEIDKMCNKDVSPIKLTKTQDITKIKGWRKKKLFVENSAKPNNNVQKTEDSNESSGEGCSYSMKEVSKKCDEALNVFASNNLEGFLEEQRSLNISYDVPNLESSKHEIDYLDSTVFIHEPSGKCLEKKRQYVLAENEDSNTLKQNVKTDASKPRTLAEKRKLLNKSEDNDDSMIRSSIYYNGARYIIPSKYKKTIYIGSHRKTKKKYKFVPVDERRRHKPSILNKETVDEKPKVFYKPGPLCKKQFLQQSCNEDWESVLVKLPAISVAIKPESTKPVHPIVRPFVKFNTFEINENRADFALSALIDNKNKQKFTFKVDYERDQQEILMRKRILKNSIKTQPGDTEDNSLPENVNRVIATMMDDLIRCVENSEIENKIIQEDPDYAPYIEDMVIPSKYKEKKVKRQIIKGSARRTNLELKRLNVKVIEVNIEDDHQPIVDCKKPFCKLGCVCHSLDKTTLPSDHCGNHHCIFKCKCSKRKDTLKFVLPSGTDLLSECTVNKLENEAKKDLAKVEKEFTQTVIHANNKTIVFGNSNERKRRSLKQPKKYEDYIETSIIAEDLCEKIVAAPVLVKKPRPEMKPCFVRVEKLNLDHVIPYCWNHNVYDCDCGYKMSKEDLEVHSMQEETMESRLNDLVDSKLTEHTVNIAKDSNLNKLEMKRKSQSVEEDEFIEVSNMAIEETILSQRKSWKSWKSKDVVHCARTMGISTSYYMERNRMKQFKKMLVKKLGLYDGKIDFNKWVEDVEKPAKITKSVNDRLCVQTKPNEPAKASGRRKQHLLTREEVYINEQNKKKIEEDIFHNYPEVYKPSELVIQKFNELLGADKNEENDYRLLQWSTMLQRYEAKVWEIWTAPSETKIRFIITNNKTTSVSGFVNIRTFEELENRSTIKIDFIRWIMLRSSPGDKSPENTLLILKKSNDLWEVCGMCAKNTKNQKMKMFDNGFTATNKVNFSCNFYLKKDLIPITESGEYEEYKKISAALPNTPENTKWKILKINSTFSILQFKRNGVKIKCNELINLIKQAQRGLNTLVINNIFKEYDHKLFGIYITHNHTDKVFIGPYYENESYDFQTLRFLNNKLITTKQYSLLTGNNINPLDEEVWYKQTREHEGTISEISEPIIDLTDKEEIIIHVVDDNDTSETIEECNQIYEIVQSEHVSETESKGDEKVEPLKIKISKRKYELHETVRPSFKSKKRKSGKISDETPKKPKRKNSGNISQPDSLIDINDLNKESENKMDENIFLSESDIQKPSETTMEECEMETSVKLNANIEPIALNNFNEKDKTKTCIINTSPRSLLKSNQPQRLNVINYKKTVASVEIRYFQMLKKMMVSVGILMQSLTYPIAFKVNFSNELIHGYRSIDQEELAVYMPGCNEPMFFRSQMMATHFLQRTLEKSIIVLPDSFEIKVELVEYADYLNILSKPARSMQQSYFKEVHMIGNFEPITLREFARALTQTHLLKAKRNSEKLNDNYVYYNSVIKKLKDWCGKKAEHDPNVQKLLRAMKRDNFHLALTSLEYIYNRLNEISLCSSNKYNCEQLKLSARNLKKKLQSYRKCPMDSKTSESAEVICLDSDEEQSPVTEAPVLQPEQSILDEQFNSVSAARPELTITPVSEMNTLTDVEPNTDLSDTTIEPINNKNNCFQSLASIATQKSPSNKLAVTVQNGTVVAKPKTLKLLMLPVKKKSPVEKIDLSSFTTNTVSNMLGANLNSRQVMLTKDQLNSLKALSAKSKMNKKVKNETDESSERHADENS